MKLILRFYNTITLLYNMPTGQTNTTEVFRLTNTRACNTGLLLLAAESYYITKYCLAWACGFLPLPDETKLLLSNNTNAHCLDKDMSNPPHQHPQQPRSSISCPMTATGFPIPMCFVPPLQLHTGPQTISCTISFFHVWQQKLTSNSK